MAIVEGSNLDFFKKKKIYMYASICTFPSFNSKAFKRESSLAERYERERQGCGHFSKPNDELNDL